MEYIREALDSILEEENKKEIDAELYDDDWTKEDEEDFNTYDEDDPITPEQEAFANEIRDFLQSLIDKEEQEDGELEEQFTSQQNLIKHFQRHCLANIPGRVSTKNNIYYDFNTIKSYSKYEQRLYNIFKQGVSNTKNQYDFIDDIFNIDDVNKKFVELFKGNFTLFISGIFGLKNSRGIVNLGIHSFSSDVTTNYKDGNTLDICILTSSPKTITLYPVDAMTIKKEIIRIINKYSQLSLTPSKDDKKLLDNLNSTNNIKDKQILQEDFPKEIKTFLNKNYNLIYYEDFYWDNKSKKDFISEFLRGTELDIHKTEYKKINKEEIENTSTFPIGTLIIKIYKDIPIIWFKTRFSGPIWPCYIAIKKSNDISDYLKEKNINKKEIYDQIYIEDDKIKDIKDIDVYIPVKSINYDYKTIRDLENKTLGEIDKNIEKYLSNEFKIKNNLFWQLISRNKIRFSYSLGVAALNNAHSSSMKSKLAKWLVSKGFYKDFSKYFEPKDIKINSNNIGILTTKQISQIILDTKKELDKLVQDYAQEKDNKIKKQILKEINKKKKEYSYYLTFTHNSNDNNEISDTVGCYYLLKGLIDLIKKFINDQETVFAEDEDAISKANVEYIQDIMKKTQNSLKNGVSISNLNQKSYDFYKEIQNSLNTILDQANKLIDELKHSSKNIEYDILERTVNIIDNFKDKIKAIDNLKKTILKEDLEETSPYTSIKSNGIYSLNTGWVKHPVQQDIPDIDMEEFEKEFKVWEDKYFDLLDKESSKEEIDNLIEDIYNLRKEGMEEDGEYSIKNLIFKEFRNLGYLDNLKELRKKEISKELSLESLKEELINYSNEDETNYKTKEIMGAISQEFKNPFVKYMSLDWLSYGDVIKDCDYRDLVKLVVPYIIFNDTDYSVYFTDKLGWEGGNDYIITRKETTLKNLYKVFKRDWEEQEETLSKEEFEDHMFTIDKNGNYTNVKID